MLIDSIHLLEAIAYITAGATLATPFLLANVRVAPIFGLLDWPKARGMSEEQIPIIGPSIVVLFVASVIVLSSIYGEFSSWFFVTALLMGVMGYFDDRRPLSAVEKLFWQLLCALTIVFFDPLIYASITETYGTWGTILALFFILGLVNSINFIDGIDGLAGSMAIVGGLGVLFFSMGNAKHYTHFLLAALLVGMLVPFLYLNFKRKGFLGNSGSYFLGYVLAYLHLVSPVVMEGMLPRISLSGLCFIVPIADAIVVIVSRTLTVRSPFVADKGHLHHRMVQTSIPLRYVLFNFGAIGLGGLIIAVVLHATPEVSNSSVAVMICISQVSITGILILLMEKASKRRVQSYIERLDDGQPLYYLKYKLHGENGQPITSGTLRRLEALLSAEIRVTDICFTRGKDELFLVLKSLQEPMKWIASRFTPVFQNENLGASIVSDRGQFVKVSTKIPTRKKPPQENNNSVRLKKAL